MASCMDFREAARRSFERNTVLSAQATVAGKIFEIRKYNPSPQIENCLKRFEAFCSEILPSWVDNIQDCERVRRGLWVKDHELASEIARVGLDSQQVDAEPFRAEFERYQNEKRRWLMINSSKKGGVIDRTVKKQMLSAMINACQRNE